MKFLATDDRRTLKPYQSTGVDVIDEHNGVVLQADEMGLGKAETLTAKLLTPTGWTTMGQIQVGDLVIGSDGFPHAVTGVFPQGRKPCYRVTFSDGAATECCGDHLWAVNTPLRKWRGQPYKVRSLHDIMQKLRDGAGNCRHFIPLVQPVQFYARAVGLDPYLLGYLIANGCMTQHTITCTVPDLETVDRLSVMMPYDVSMNQTTVSKERPPIAYHFAGTALRESLKALGLFGHRSEAKFVPPDYLFNTVEIRLALFQGLMDGDGSVTEADNHLEYSTASKQLAEDVVFLVQSLGGTARINIKEEPKYVYDAETRTGMPSHRVSIALPDGVYPFRLRRKADTYRPRVKYQPTRAIVAVEPIGEQECQCISVDAADHLYVTDDFIVTHNTFQVLYWLRHRAKPAAFPAVVVCPAYLKWMWVREAGMLGMTTMMLNGETPYEDMPPDQLPHIIIVNYDILEHHVDWLRSHGVKTVILDECHYIKNRGTIRSKAVRRLAKGLPHIMALSGTPLTNRPAELFSVLNLLWPGEFAAWHPYAVQYCAPKKQFWGWEYKGATNLPELHQRLVQQGMIRRLKRDVLKDLPPIIRDVIPVGIKERHVYKEAERGYIQWLSTQDAAAARRAARSGEALARSTGLKRLAARLSWPQKMEWVENFLDANPDEKLAVYCIHLNGIAAMMNKFGKIAVQVHGSVSTNKRDAAVQAFQNNPKIRLFVGQMEAAGTGLTLTAAKTLVFMEQSFVPATHTQVEARIHRIGQEGQAMIYYLVAAGTVEEDLCDVLQHKQSILSDVLDGGNGENLSVMELLTDKLLKRKRGLFHAQT